MPNLAAMDGGGSSYDPRQQAIQNRREQPAPVPQYRPATPPAAVSPSYTGQYVRPQAPPQSTAPGPIQNIEAYLGADTGYQQQIRSFNQALQDFLADVTRRRGTLETDFGTSKKAMDDQRVMDLDRIKDDYGARGLGRSGLYADAVGDYETEFGTRMSELQRRQNEALAGLTQEEGNFKSQQELKTQQAKEQAIARRAAQYGL